MKLHEFEQEFRQLISIVARQKHISESAVERDYYIVMMLQKLEQSEYANKCVFKGGTSLSKCYPGSRRRHSGASGPHRPDRAFRADRSNC